MKLLLVFSLCCLLLPCFSCSSSKPKPDTAESKAMYGTMKLGLPGSVKGTVEPTTVFLTSDASIVERVSRRTTIEQVPTITPRIEKIGNVSLTSMPATGK